MIAAVDGVCYGAGFSLALAADFTVCTPRARFCQAFVRIGLVPDFGALFLLPRAVGLRKAKELMLTGRVVEPDELDSAVEEELALILALPAASIASTKKLFNDVIGRPPRDCMDYTAAALADAWETENASEGIAAFLGKRSPSWKVKRR